MVVTYYQEGAINYEKKIIMVMLALVLVLSLVLVSAVPLAADDRAHFAAGSAMIALPAWS